MSSSPSPSPGKAKSRWFDSDNQRVAVISSTAAIIAALITATATFLVTHNSTPDNSAVVQKGSAPSISASPISSPTDTPTYLQPSQAVSSPDLSAGQQIFPQQYTVGVCFNYTTAGNVQTPYYAACSSPHDGQIVALLYASGAPSLSAADGVMGTECSSTVNSLDQQYGAQAKPYLQTPNDYDFGNGVRSFTCFAETNNTTTTTTSLVTWLSQ